MSGAIDNPRLATKMEELLSDMQAKYDGLTAKMSEATVNPEDFDRHLARRSCLS